MNLDSNIVQKTIQSLLTDVAPKVLTSPDISILTDNIQTIPEHSSSSSSSSSSEGEAPTITRHKTEQKNSEKKRHDDDDPVIELYEQMNAANIEFNTQTNSGCLKFQESEIDIQVNESTFIPAGHQHRLTYPGKDLCVLIEVQTGDYLGEDDIVRLEDTYGRT